RTQDEARIPGLQGREPEAHAFQRPRRKVFHESVRLGAELTKQLLAFWAAEIEGDALLVPRPMQVRHADIVFRLLAQTGPFGTTKWRPVTLSLRAVRLLHFNHLGSESTEQERTVRTSQKTG